MQNKITKSEALGMVADSIGSIFTKDDVLELIGRIDTESDESVSWDDLKNFLSEYIVDNMDVDCVDTDSAEFELDGATIQLSNIEVDSYSVESIVRDAVDAYTQK